MRILVDMDGIVADLLAKWLRVIEQTYGVAVGKGDVQTWNLHESVPGVSREQVYQLVLRPGFYDDLAPIPGAIEGVKKLMDVGHDVRLATSACGADCARAKIDWVSWHLGMSEREMFVCHSKSWIDADVLIDDKPATLHDWKAERLDHFVRTLTIAYPYNLEVQDEVSCYAQGWRDTESAWAEMVRMLL